MKRVRRTESSCCRCPCLNSKTVSRGGLWPLTCALLCLTFGRVYVVNMQPTEREVTKAEKRIPTVGLVEVNPPSLLCFPLLSPMKRLWRDGKPRVLLRELWRPSSSQRWRWWRDGGHRRSHAGLLDHGRRPSAQLRWGSCCRSFQRLVSVLSFLKFINHFN